MLCLFYISLQTISYSFLIIHQIICLFVVKHGDISLKNLSIMNYFTLREIYKNCTPSEFRSAQRNNEVLKNISILRDVLNEVRDFVNEPIIVTSWYRDVEHNKRVGGVRNSHHLTGGAADITCSNLDILFKKCFIMPQFTQIIRYDTFIHVSIIPTKNKRIYDKRTTKQD